MHNRCILWLALAGMILTIHLWVQKERGFDQGCLGLGQVQTPEPGGCIAVSRSPAGNLFGISNAAWGYAFYFGLALLTFAKLLTPAVWARRLHLASEVAVGGALLYSGWLLYEMAFVARAWCVLCLTSDALVVALVLVHLGIRLRGGFAPVEASARPVELGLASGSVFGAVGVLVGVVVIVDRVGTRPLDQGAARTEFLEMFGAALPQFIDSNRLAEMRACHLDFNAPIMTPGNAPAASAPFIGAAQGPEVVVYYDPNCPHCKQFHVAFRHLMEANRDRARFTIRPRVLWDESVLQVEALKLAETSPRYFDLWQRMFEMQPGPHLSLTVAQIGDLFRDLGLDTNDLSTRLASARRAVNEDRARAAGAGIDRVPAIFVGEHPVWSGNQNESCITTLIGRVIERSAQAAAATTAP